MPRAARRRKRLPDVRLALCGAFAFLAVPAALAQRLVVSPASGAVTGDLTGLRIDGLVPGDTVDLRAERALLSGRRRVVWRSSAAFAVPADGRLDLATARPLGGRHAGTYRGADLRGLFWSMAPTDTPAPEGASGDAVALTVQGRGEREPRRLGTLPVPLAAAGVQRREVGDALPASVLFTPPGAAPRGGWPVVVVLGGSEGGRSTAEDVGPRLASQGLAVLGLVYYAPAWGGARAPEYDGLPSAFVDIPLDRLDDARAWIGRQPGLDGGRIGVWGVSKGAEFALAAAARMPWIACVVGVVPSDVVWEGWGLDGQAEGTRASFAWRGTPLPFVPYEGINAEFAGYQTGADVRLRRPHDRGRARHPERALAARIRVEDYAGPVLVAGSSDDQIWASGAMAQRVAEQRAAAALPTTVLVFPDAGHSIVGDGWLPTTQYSTGPGKAGGTPAANARAQAELWAATVAFLRQHLGVRP